MLRLFLISFLLISSSLFSVEKPELPFNDRVHEAKKKNEVALKNLFRAKRVDYPPAKILMRVFKLEKTLELYARSSKSRNYTFIKTYSICKVAGKLGPKWQEGDLQVPEGIYQITRLNPEGEYHLALEINYPNDADHLRTPSKTPGGDIFLHGTCISYGCLAVGNRNVEQIYWLVHRVMQKYQPEISIQIFPYYFDRKKISARSLKEETKKTTLELWNSLKKIYLKFNQKKIDYNIVHTADGYYTIQEE